MTRTHPKKIRTALLSVYDKTGLVPFARGLAALGIRILSTGRTARALKEAGVRCVEVSRITRFPEMLDGRVKTLHPRIHAGILADRANAGHLGTLKRFGIPPIDLVVVNLYPFADAVKNGADPRGVIEMIDIGGPAMLRAAAKNASDVVAVCDIADYAAVLSGLKTGALGELTRRKLAAKVFAQTSAYDGMIARYFAGASGAAGKEALPPSIRLEYRKSADLRYGENPHQKGAVYRSIGPIRGLADARVLGGKELSFNNFLDMESAWALTASLGGKAACVVKHTNPCGAAVGRTAAAAFRGAFACDPRSAFGGIVGFNRRVDENCARAVRGAGFLECVVAPAFSAAALKILKQRKNLRLVATGARGPRDALDFKRITGGLLVQEPDRRDAVERDLKTVTRRRPSPRQVRDLLFAFKISRFVKSNAIVVVKNGKTVGIGMGQPSRVASVVSALRKAGARARGAALASDGFFPKPDSIRAAARAGIRAIIQPGGSIRDEAVLRACDRARIACVFTGIRHFTH